MGDRYDRLRINHLDIGDNEHISTKSMKILAYNLIAKSLKTVNLNGSMNLHTDSFQKIICLTEGFMNEIKNLKII